MDSSVEIVMGIRVTIQDSRASKYVLLPPFGNKLKFKGGSSLVTWVRYSYNVENLPSTKVVKLCCFS